MADMIEVELPEGAILFLNLDQFRSVSFNDIDTSKPSATLTPVGGIETPVRKDAVKPLLHALQTRLWRDKR